MLVPFFKAGATSDAFVLEPKHQKFPRCDTNSICIIIMKPPILLLFGQQTLNRKSDMEKEKEWEIQVRLLSSGKFPSRIQPRVVWKAPRGAHSVQSFPDHITMYFSQYHFDMELYENVLHSPCASWSKSGSSI